MILGRSVLLSVAMWGALLVVLRVGVIPPESCGATDPSASLTAGREAVAEAAVETTLWMTRALNPDGSYVYIYDRDDDAIPGGYSDVRHAGVTMSLYQAAGRLEGPAADEAMAAADEAMGWMIERLVRPDGQGAAAGGGEWAALAPDGRFAQLGATALMLVSLSERRAATGDTQYDDLMRELARFITMSQKEDGNFYVYWYHDRQEFDLESTSRYYPGESWFALTLMHKAFPEEGWDEPAWRAAEYIIKHRDEDEDVSFPPLADQWAAYALAEMRDWGLPDGYIDYAKRLAARWGLVVRSESQKGSEPFGDYIRGPDVRGSGVGTWVEGLAALWRLSAADERMADVREKIAERTVCIAGILAERVVDEEEAERYGRPELVRGGIFYKGETRMDDQQHAASGFIYAGDVMDGRTEREPQR